MNRFSLMYTHGCTEWNIHLCMTVLQSLGVAVIRRSRMLLSSPWAALALSLSLSLCVSLCMQVYADIQNGSRWTLISRLKRWFACLVSLHTLQPSLIMVVIMCPFFWQLQRICAQFVLCLLHTSVCVIQNNAATSPYLLRVHPRFL